jgi:hypothetical protein
MGDWFIIPLEWPRGSLKRWLMALGTVAALCLILYALFSWLGW